MHVHAPSPPLPGERTRAVAHDGGASPRPRPRRRSVALVLLASTLAPALVACGGGGAVGKEAASPSPGGARQLVVMEKSADGTAVLDRSEADAPATEPSEAPASPPPPPAPPAQGFASPGVPGAGALGGAEEAKAARMVYTARLALAVHAVEPSLDAVTRLAVEQGGYLALREDTSVTLRIPRARFHATLEAVGSLGDVLHRDVRAEDVSDEWVDLEARIKNARALRERLRALLERAAVKEAIEIEKELARVTEELERLEGKMKLLADKVAYSTITVTFAPRGGAGAPPTVRLPFGWVGGLGLGSLMNLQETK